MYEFIEIKEVPYVSEPENSAVIAFVVHDTETGWKAMIHPVGHGESIARIVEELDPDSDGYGTEVYLDGMADEIHAMENWDEVLEYLRFFVNSIQVGETFELDDPYYLEFDVRDEVYRLGSDY